MSIKHLHPVMVSRDSSRAAHEPATGTPVRANADNAAAARRAGRSRMDALPGRTSTGRAPAASHGGAALPRAVQVKMERAFGFDFSAVRVHEGTEARNAGAAAFTTGSDIHFAPGKYDPWTAPGQELLGHELTHVVQQHAAGIAGWQAKGPTSSGPDRLEAEADELGRRAAAGQSAEVRHAAAQGSVQRKKGLEPDQHVIVSGERKGIIVAISGDYYDVHVHDRNDVLTIHEEDVDEDPEDRDTTTIDEITRFYRLTGRTYLPDRGYQGFVYEASGWPEPDVPPPLVGTPHVKRYLEQRERDLVERQKHGSSSSVHAPPPFLPDMESPLPELEKALDEPLSSHVQPQQSPKVLIEEHEEEDDEPLTSEGLKSMLTTHLRTDFARALTALDIPGDEVELVSSALLAAQLTYMQECERLRLNAPSLEIPPPDTLEDSVVQSFDATIRSCPEIYDDLAEHHWLETDRSGDKETYIAARHRAERIKAAAAWSQAAAKVVRLEDRRKHLTAKNMPSEMLRRLEKREGRDMQGRLAYLLMGSSDGELMEHMGINQRDVMTGRAQGAGCLEDSLLEVFNTAACHNDARLMCDLLSGEMYGKSTRSIESSEDVPPLVEEVMTLVNERPDVVRLLKLSVYSNHSVLYVIGGPDGRATKLETVAGMDSKNILINDVIQGRVTSSDNVEQAIRAAFGMLSQDAPVELEYEVHEAAGVGAVEERLEARLGDGLARIGVGLAVGSWELADVQDKMLDDYGLPAMIEKESVRIPLGSMGPGRGLALHEFTSTDLVSAPKKGERYRLECEGNWLFVRAGEVVEDGTPKWLHPLIDLEIVDVTPNAAQPQIIHEVTEDGESMSLMQGQAWFNGFNLMSAMKECQVGKTYTSRDGVRYVVTKDDQHEGKKPNRTIVITRQD